MLRIIVVDDEYLVRMGITQTIDWSEYGVEIAGEADNGEDGLELALQYRPDVIITDVRMPHMNGLEFIAKVKEHQLDAGIIVLSGYDEFQYAQTAMKLGASTYLLKPVDVGQLAQSVLEIGEGVLARRSDTERLGFLNKEIGSIARQFWLDLLHGSPLTPEETKEKAERLGLPFHELFPLCAIAVSRPKQEQRTVDEQAADSLQQLIADQLEAYSEKAAASLRSADDQWVIVVSLGADIEASLARFRTFGVELVGAAATALPSSEGLAVGIGSPARRPAELRGSYLAAVHAAERAASALTPVLLAGEQAEDSYRKEIRAALAYIRARYAENVTVEKVAAEVYVSPTHLMHLFRKELNKTFSECLTEYRIEMAKRMLRDPKYRVYEVGDLVGFGDSKYFSQVFKKMTGMPPSEYAKTR